MTPAASIEYVGLQAAAFIGDEDCAGWSSAEFGIYCRIIFYLYANDGSLKFEPLAVARMCNCTVGEFMPMWENGIEKKFVVRNGRIRHKRVTAELSKAKERRQAKRRAGLAGAKKTWQRHSTAKGTAKGTALGKSKDKGKGKVKVKKPTTAKESTRKLRDQGPQIPEALQTPVFAEAWAKWQAYRREIKHPMTSSTMTAQLKKLAAVGPIAAINTIEQSIEKGWQGLHGYDRQGTQAARSQRAQVGDAQRADATEGRFDEGEEIQTTSRDEG